MRKVLPICLVLTAGLPSLGCSTHGQAASGSPITSAGGAGISSPASAGSGVASSGGGVTSAGGQGTALPSGAGTAPTGAPTGAGSANSAATGTFSGGAGMTLAGAGSGGAAGAPSSDGGSAGGTPSGGGTAGATAQGGGGGAGGTEPCVVDHGGEVPALGEYYSGLFSIGAAIDTSYGNYDAVLTKHFNSITAENEMKFDALQPSEGNFTYGTADGMVSFAQSNEMDVRGHALVWHRQTPSWVFNGSANQVLQRMRTHITNVMQHFAGKVQIWDVVNEAIMDDGRYRSGNEASGQESGWYGALGESYIAEAFIAARAADTTAKLFYNDYYNYHPVRRQAIYDMLAGLLADDVPVDGVGLQCHLNLEPGTNPDEQSYHQTVENLEEAIVMYSSLGLEVQITEMDLSLYLRGITYTPDTFYTPAKVTPEILEQQAERYRSFVDMFRRHSDVITSLTFWGIADDNTWLSEFDSGRQDFPLLFDSQQQPKPAFWAVVDFCR